MTIQEKQGVLSPGDIVGMTTALARRPPAKPEFLGLAKYDAMVSAIAECHSIDEVKNIHDLSIALEKYANQAKNYDAELRAMDVRIRASQRAGELIAEGQKNGTIAHVGQPRKERSSETTILSPKKLEELGISKDQSSQWQQLAGIEPKEVEKQLPLATGKRTSVKRIIRESRPKRDPAREREQKLETFALRIWGRLRDLPTITEDMPLKEVVGAMNKQLVDGVTRSIPKVRTFLSALEVDLEGTSHRRSTGDYQRGTDSPGPTGPNLAELNGGGNEPAREDPELVR